MGDEKAPLDIEPPPTVLKRRGALVVDPYSMELPLNQVFAKVLKETWLKRRRNSNEFKRRHFSHPSNHPSNHHLDRHQLDRHQLDRHQLDRHLDRHLEKHHLSKQPQSGLGFYLKKKIQSPLIQKSSSLRRSTRGSRGGGSSKHR